MASVTHDTMDADEDCASGADDEEEYEPRRRMFPAWHTGPYVVFIRDGVKTIKPLTISTYVHRKYKSVTAATTIQRQKKMKFTLTDITEANDLIMNVDLTGYRVYIQADEVETVGAINFSDIHDINDIDDIVDSGTGVFKNTQMDRAEIVDVYRLSTPATADNENVHSMSNTVKVTFGGRMLPSHIEIRGLLIKVRPWFQRAMFCENCQRFKHTSKYCKSKARCAKCDGEHPTGKCVDQHVDHTVCPYCKTTHAEGQHNCAHFKQANRDYFNAQKQNARKNALRMPAPTTQDFPALQSTAQYTPSSTAAIATTPSATSYASQVTNSSPAPVPVPAPDQGNQYQILPVDVEETPANTNVQRPAKRPFENPWAKKSPADAQTKVAIKRKAPQTRTATAKPTQPQRSKPMQDARKPPPGFAADRPGPQQPFETIIVELIIQICNLIGLSEPWLTLVKSIAPMLASFITDKLPTMQNAQILHAASNIRTL